MEKFNVEKLKSRTEIIDGVTVLYTGLPGIYKDEELGYQLGEKIEMCDENGNPFYSNYNTKEPAEEAIKDLDKSGKKAIIGPKAPLRNKDGVMVPNDSKTAVGVYLLNE